MNNARLIGINEAAIDNLSLNIIQHAENVKKLLSEATKFVTETGHFYNSDVAEKYRSSFELFATNFQVIINNVVSYSDELIRLKLIVTTNDKLMKKDIINSADMMENLHSEYKEVK